MSDYCVVVAASKKARLYTLEAVERPEMESGPNLIEHSDLVNQDLSEKGTEVWSEIKSGRNRASGGAGGHGYDDHRSNHEDEYEKRFLHSIAREALELASKKNAKQMVLVAHNRTLNHLRTAMSKASQSGITVMECSKDLSQLGIQELHEHLARERLIPRRRRFSS